MFSGHASLDAAGVAHTNQAVPSGDRAAMDCADSGGIHLARSGGHGAEVGTRLEELNPVLDNVGGGNAVDRIDRPAATGF